MPFPVNMGLVPGGVNTRLVSMLNKEEHMKQVRWVAFALAFALVSCCSMPPRLGIGLPDPPGGYTKGLMLTDAACDKDLQDRRNDEVADILKKYNTILTLVDLQIPPTTANFRPYVAWGRNKGKLTEVGECNLKYLVNCGFRVHVITLNTYACKHGWSHLIGSVQKGGVRESRMYTAEQLAIEKAFLDDLLKKVPKIAGIMPTLESTSASNGFVKEICRYLREDKGFKGVISINGPSMSASDLQKYQVWTAPSINSPSRWKSSGSAVRNSDGMTALHHTRPDLIQLLTGNPGPCGVYLWAPELVGSAGGPCEDIPSAYMDNAVWP
jgi:hypothetical protein